MVPGMTQMIKQWEATNLQYSTFNHIASKVGSHACDAYRLPLKLHPEFLHRIFLGSTRLAACSLARSLGPQAWPCIESGAEATLRHRQPREITSLLYVAAALGPRDLDEDLLSAGLQARPCGGGPEARLEVVACVFYLNHPEHRLE